MIAKPTPMSSIALVLVASFIGSFGAVFLKSGAHRLKRHWTSVAFNWRLAAGVFAFVLSSVFFVAGIKEGELTLLYPIMALGYVWTLLWSRMFFHEPLTKNKFIGLGLILVGIACLNLGNK